MTILSSERNYHKANFCKNLLYEKYVKYIKDEYIQKYNRNKIIWTFENIILPQLESNNEGENQVLSILEEYHFEIKTQSPIVLLDDSKKITHIYVADFLIDDKIIVEVDGSVHNNTIKHDEERDLLTTEAGYITIRIPRTDNEYNVELIVNSILQYAKHTPNNDITRKISEKKQEIFELENDIRVLKSQYK